MHGHSLFVLRPCAVTVVVIVLVSEIVKLADLRVRVEELDVPVRALLTVLVMVPVSEVVEGAELEDVDAVVTASVVVQWVAVKDVALKLRVLEVVFVGDVVGTLPQTPQVAPWQDAASTTKHQAPPV